MLEIVHRQNVPHVRLAGWLADYADPDNFLRIACRYETSWQSRAFDRLIDEARQITHQEQRMALYQQADRILVEEAPIVPLAYVRGHILVKPWVRYVPPRLFIWPWKDFTIDPH